MYWCICRNTGCAWRWGSFDKLCDKCNVINQNAHARPGHALGFFLCRLKQLLSFPDVNIPMHDGGWLDLVVCNFAGLIFRLSPSMFLYSKGVCESSKEHFVSICRHSALSIVFSESLMYSSVSKRLFPLKLCFLVLSWEVTVLFLLVGLVSYTKLDLCGFLIWIAKCSLYEQPAYLDICRNGASAADWLQGLPCGRGSDTTRAWKKWGKANFYIVFFRLTREDRLTTFEYSLKSYWEVKELRKTA